MNTQNIKRYIMPLFAFFILFAGARAGTPFEWQLEFNCPYFIRDIHVINEDSALVVSENKISIISTKDGKELFDFPDVTKYIPWDPQKMSSQGIGNTDLSSDKKLLVTATLFDFENSYVVVWDAVKGIPLKRFVTKYKISGIKFSIDSKYIIASIYNADEAVVVWNTSDYTIEKKIINPGIGAQATVSPDNKYFYISYLLEDGNKRLTFKIIKYSLENWQEIGNFNLNDQYGISMLRYAAGQNTISPNGKYFAFTCDTTVYVYNTDKLQLVNMYNFTTYPSDNNTTLGAVSFSPNSDKLFINQSIHQNNLSIEWDYILNKELTRCNNNDIAFRNTNMYLPISEYLIGSSGCVIGAADIKSFSSSASTSSLSNKLRLFYENPISKETTLKLVVKDSLDVQIDIFDESGNLIKNLYKGYLKAEEIQLQLNIDLLANGFYILRVSSGNNSIDYSLIVVK